MSLFGGIEAGGTKFVCAAGTGPEDVREEVRFATTTPDECIGKCLEFFQAIQSVHGPLSAVGIASFGPWTPDPGRLPSGTSPPRRKRAGRTRTWPGQ